MEGSCRRGFLVTITMSFLIALAEAYESCNIGYLNFFICFDDGEMQGYCCDLQSNHTYAKCCYKYEPTPPYHPPDDNAWLIVLVPLIALVVLAIILWCIRCYRTRRQDAEDRNIEAVVERSTARQRHGQVRPNNGEPTPPSYDQVTKGGTSDENKELLSGLLYAMPQNYQATGGATNAPTIYVPL